MPHEPRPRRTRKGPASMELRRLNGEGSRGAMGAARLAKIRLDPTLAALTWRGMALTPAHRRPRPSVAPWLAKARLARAGTIPPIRFGRAGVEAHHSADRFSLRCETNQRSPGHAP